jgi:iron complex transport system substrate-binding protein
MFESVSIIRLRVARNSHACFAMLAALLFCAMIFTGCKPAERTQNEPHDNTPQRIVSMSPGVTEIMFFLGEQHRLVGRTDHCNFPAEAADIPSIGGFGQPSVERIVALRPDLILTTNSSAHPSFAKLQSLNMNVRNIETQSLDDVFAMILEIGKMLDVETKAKKRVDALRAQVNAVRARHKNETHALRTYVEIDYSPIFTVGSEGFLNDMLDILGAENIFHDINQGYPQVGAEAVILRDPEIIFLGHGTYGGNALEKVRARTGWSGIAAVRKGRVYGDLNPDLYHRPSPRLVDGLLEMEKRIYGEAE